MKNSEKTTKKVKINIRSLFTDPDEEETEANVETVQSSQSDDDSEFVEFSTEGTMTVRGNTVEISYRENEDLGMSDVMSTLRFKKTRPSMVSLIRRGASPVSLMFDSEYPRQNCLYSVGDTPLNLCICTNDVENTFDESGGRIMLDYEIEMQGMKTERNVFTLEYKG